MPLSEIIEQQHRWARKQWPGHTARRAPSLAANLNFAMTPEFAAQFGGGSGGELGKEATADRPRIPGKMESLRSSSALAFNFFAPWHGQAVDPLARALGVSLSGRTVEFEKKFRHGLGSAPPNLDVVLDGLLARPLAIESKFTEPYGPKDVEHPLDEKYMSQSRKRWSELGLPRCQELAEAAGKTILFRRLGAAQLLKHILGVAHTTKQRPRLLCIWFDSGCSEAAEHRAELRRFADAIGDDLDFTHRTYQEAIASLSDDSGPTPGYVTYLRARYLAA